jgi:LEA14-like dessication related protein
MKIEKKYIIATGLGVVSIAAGLAYLQYKKIMDYVITFKGIKSNKIASNNVDIDLTLNLQNKSSVKYDILSQEYNVYVGGNLISSAKNLNKQTVMPNSISPVTVNVKFNPDKSGKDLLNTIISLRPLVVMVDMKLKVKLWMFTVTIPYVYQTSLKDLLSKKSAS